MKTFCYSKPASLGFTLKNLIIVIAIIGVLATVVNSLKNSSRIKANEFIIANNVGTASMIIKKGFQQNAAFQAMHVDESRHTMPVGEAELIDYLNTKTQAKAVDHGNAYASTANDETGVIGISVNAKGTRWNRGDTVTISAPAYSNLKSYDLTIKYK